MGHSFLKRTILSLGGDTILRAVNRVPRVLFWHGVDKRYNEEVEQEILEIDTFKQQIDYLKRHYEIISIDEFNNRLLANQFSGYEVVLTFDDGYANNLYVVAPILNQLNLPFTVFVSTEHVDTGSFFPTSVNRIITKGSSLKVLKIPSMDLKFLLSTDSEKKCACDYISSLMKSLPIFEVKRLTQELISNVSKDEWDALMIKYRSVRPMTWSEVQALSKIRGVTIGSHCMWHICCHNKQRSDIVRDQIEESKKKIEDNINIACDYFAYPNGDYTDFSNKIVERNYLLGFSTESKKSVSRAVGKIMPRISIPSNFDTFRLLLNLYPNQ